MKTDGPEQDRDNMLAIVEILRQHGDAATQGRTLEALAGEWLAAGFDDPEEIGEWLDARCLTAEGARTLERAGFTPEQAAMPTTAGTGGYTDTVGFKLISGDLSYDEARRIITSEFWNT